LRTKKGILINFSIPFFFKLSFSGYQPEYKMSGNN
jgi:hypothetical protein